MRFLWSSAVKDVRRQLHDPLAFAMWLGIPLAIATLILLAFGRSGQAPNALVLVADEDKSVASAFLVNALSQASVITTEKATPESGRRRLEKGEASALLVIPDGFADAVFTDSTATLLLVTNPAQRTLPGIVEETLSIFVDGAFYVRRVLRQPLDEIVQGPAAGASTFPDSTIGAISITINHIVERLEKYLFPPVVDLDVHVASTSKATTTNLGALFFPGILFMSLLFMAQGMSGDVWQEATRGTLRRVLMTPQRVASFLAGKVLAAAILMAAVSLGGLVIGVAMFDLAWVHVPLALVWSVFAGTLFTLLLLLIQTFASSERVANLLTTFILFPLLMVGGSFFPFEAMPDWLARIGERTPNGWALKQLADILWGRVQWTLLGIAFLMLSALGLVLFRIGAWRLRFAFVGR